MAYAVCNSLVRSTMRRRDSQAQSIHNSEEAARLGKYWEEMTIIRPYVLADCAQDYLLMAVDVNRKVQNVPAEHTNAHRLLSV